MLIAGSWFTADDGSTRPIVAATVVGPDGQSQDEAFLIDSGADRTVLRASLRDRLGLSAVAAPPGFSLTGIGGTTAFVMVAVALELTTADGRPIRVSGFFSVFSDPAASDTSILGRDVLDNFDLIVSRRRDEVLLLAPNHAYQVVTG